MVLIQYRAVLVMVLGGWYGVSIGRYWLVLGGAGSVLGDNGKFFIGLHLLKNVEIWSDVTNPDHSSCLESLYGEWGHEPFRL